jgi:hypothetical protein
MAAMTKRFASTCIVSLVSVGATIASCGGDDGGGSGGDANNTVIDAKIFLDAAGSGSGSGVMGIGQACTPPAMGSGQGDCPPGYTCLAVQGFTHPWCSKPCATGSGDMCAIGYSGPGVAGCINLVSFNGGSAMSFCGITCAGDGVNGCTAQTCMGTCPGQLMCNAPLMDGSGNTVGSACQ